MKHKMGMSILALLILSGCANANQKVRECIVGSKERVQVGTGQQQHGVYRIYCNDGLVLDNKDAIVFGKRWKMDSASLQAKIKPGAKYKMHTIGWRIPFLSAFPNVYQADEIEAQGHD